MAAETAKPNTDEIASAATDFDIFQGFLNQLANPDKVLALEAGGDITVYDDIGRDPRISSNLGTRARAVVGKEWSIIPASDDAKDVQIAEYVKKVLLGFPFDRIRRSLLRGGTLKGFAVGEVMWDISEGDVFIKDILYRHQRRFLFDTDRHLLLKTIGNPLGEDVTIRDGVELRKFQVVTFGDEVETPWGIGLGRELYWPWWFKKNDLRFWLRFGDKWGGPTVVGEYDPGTPKEKQDELLSAANSVHTNSSVIHPKGMILRLLEASRSGSVNTYSELMTLLNDEITICILGQTATTQGSPGKLGNDTAQENVRLDLVKADADALCEAFHSRDGGLIRWIVDYQFPGHGRYPQMWIDCEEEEDKKTLSERDKNLSEAMEKSGLRLKSSYYVRVHGIKEDEIEAKPAEGATPPAKPAKPGTEVSFAEGDEPSFPDQELVDLFAASFTPEELQALTAGVLKPLLDLSRDGGDLVDLMARLAEIFPAMDADKLQDVLTRLIFVSEVWGRLSAKGEA